MKNKSPPLIEIYCALIATPSIGAMEETLDQGNVDLVTPLADWLKNSGFSMEVQPVPGTRDEFNTLASCGQGTGGLLLAGHTDTVPFDNGRWTHDSSALTGHGDELYGLGTADTRGSFAFVLDTLRDVDVTKLAKPLYVLATANKETDVAGARHFAGTTALRPDCAIIGEPTSPQPVRAHKGHISNAIRIQGQSGHSNDPTRGVNAIELVHDAIGHILQLCDNLRERYHCGVFTVPYPTLNLGHTHGGDVSNRICAYCGLHMGIRPPPGTMFNRLNGLLDDTLAPANERQPGHLTVDELYPPVLGYECPPNHQLVEVAERLLGAKAEVVNHCTRALFVQALCPMLVLGPGLVNQVHQPDEYLETRFIKPTRELITQVIHHFCRY